MRAIFFNIWHGQVWDKLKSFIDSEKDKTDIFGFLEVNPAVQEKLKSILPEHQNVYNKGFFIEYNGGVFQGHSVFLNKSFKVTGSTYDELFTQTLKDAGGLLAIDLKIKGKDFWLGVVHGMAQPGNKLDIPERLIQSQKILATFKDKPGPVLIGGDFNLYPDTESVKMFEKSGYRNLIREFKITNTRNKISWQQFGTPQYFADYCFVKNIEVKDFKVPALEASDHEPQILDFEI